MPKQYGLTKGSEESNLVTFKDGFQKSGNSMLKKKISDFTDEKI